MLSTLDFSHEADLDIETLVRRMEGYFKDADFTQLKKAYEFAEKAHRGQKRRSGEDYIIHPLNVAATLIKLRLDMDSIIAGLLHDVIEDCEVTSEQLSKEFSPVISQIVLGLTKISKIKFKTQEENQAENFRKMVVAMAKDIRVIIVKLADRMHNMRTLQYVSVEKQNKVAQETMDIYVPLASRLGINSIKSELEDLCLRFLRADVYYMLAEKVAMKRSERENYIKEVVAVISEKLLEYSVVAELTGRPKHFYSIYKKMSQRSVDFEQIQDILAFRIVVNNITECYKTLGIIHSAFTPIPGRFKDYIAIPKVNNYQSLHTTVIGPKAERIEVQIRTYEMHEVAEAGVAAHWKYKEGLSGSGQKLEWIDELLEFNRNVHNNSEFLDVVKDDLDIGGVFVFTPTGDVRELKDGSTPLDFAYSIHTEVGNLCMGAKINGKIVPLKYRLKSGDVVEILTNKAQHPSKDWLKIVRSSRAKTKIKQWLLKAEREKQRDLGESVIEKAARAQGTSLKALKKNGLLEKMISELHFKNEDELFVNIGSGKCMPREAFASLPEFKENANVIEQVESFYNKVSKSAQNSSHKDNAIIVEGIDDILVRMAKCCNPIPGDPIAGFITRGRGVTVHTGSCKKKEIRELERVIRVEWNEDFRFKHPVNIRVITHDKPGILAKISKTINNVGINIRSAVAKSVADQRGNFLYEVEVSDYSELLKIISVIESMEEVISVSRGQ